MKILKISLMILAVASFTCIANAQRGVDMFGVPRSLVLAAPQALAVPTLLVTNGPIDTHGYEGIGVVDMFSLTNAAAMTITASFFTSPDQTNLTALANYALAVSASESITNYMYGGTSLICTQTKLAPGTVTAPTASSAGWATPYLLPAAFTNNGAVTLTAKGNYEIGYNVSDAARYLYVVTSGTNATWGALFKGYRAQ